MTILSRLNRICWVTFVLISASATLAQVPQLLNYQGRIAVNGTNFTGNGQFKFALVDGGTNLTRTATGTANVVFGFLVAVNITDGGAGYATAPLVSVTGGGGTGASLTAQVSGGVVTNVIVNNAGSGYSGTPNIIFAAPPVNVVAQTYWSNDGSSSSGGQPTASVSLPVTKGLYSVLLGDTTLSNMTALPATVFTNPDVRLRVCFSDGSTGFQQLTPDQRLAAVGYAIVAGTAQTVVDGSITASKIAAGAVGSGQLASNITIPGTLTVSNLVINGSALNSESNLQIPGGTNIQTYAGRSYFITNRNCNIILPPTANVGDTVHLRILDFEGYSIHNIQQNAGQRIVNWIKVQSGSPVASSADGNRLLVSAGPGFFFSTNLAASWTFQPPIGLRPTPISYQAFQISGDGSHIFAVGYYLNILGNFYNAIIVSGDYGQTWSVNTNFINNGMGFGNQAVACSTNGVKACAVQPFGGIYTSPDSGSNWTLQTSAPTNANWTTVASSADGSKLVAASYFGGIYTSDNSGVTWTLQTSAPINGDWRSVASSADGSKLVAASYFGGIYTSDNSGVNWTLQASTANNNTFWKSVASSADGTKLIAGAAGQYGIYTSVNSGSTWIRQTNGLPNGSSSFVASSADGLKLAAYLGGGLYTSADLGNTWAQCSTLPTPYSALVAISSLGSSGGAKFSELNDYELLLVYLGNGMFAPPQPSGGNFGGNFLYGY